MNNIGCAMKRTVFLRTYLKIIRTEGTPSSIARGVSIGLAVGLIIPVGLQTLPAIFLAFMGLPKMNVDGRRDGDI